MDKKKYELNTFVVEPNGNNEKTFCLVVDDAENGPIAQGSIKKSFITNMNPLFLDQIASKNNTVKNALFISHIDADGHSSSAVLSLGMGYNNKTVINVDYGFDFSTIKDKLIMADIIYISDLSPTQSDLDYIADTSQCQIVWIDHHESSKSIKTKANVYSFIHSVERVSAVALCWSFSAFIKYMKNYMDNEQYNYTSPQAIEQFKSKEFTMVSVPDVVRLISLFDTWADEMDDRINYGLQIADMNINSKSGYQMWGLLLSTNRTAASEILTGIINQGDVIKTYDIMQMAKYRKTQLIKCIFHIVRHKDGKTIEKDYNIALMNVNGFSSSFGDVLKEVDGCIRYYQLANGQYSYGCYSNKDNPEALNCEMLAKHFGGGGHIHAAGWTMSGNIVTGITHLNSKNGSDTKIMIIHIDN